MPRTSFPDNLWKSPLLVIISATATETTRLAVVCQVTNSQGYFCRLRKWFLFRFTLLVVFDYFCAIYSKFHLGFGIIIAMCNIYSVI